MLAMGCSAHLAEAVGSRGVRISCRRASTGSEGLACRESDNGVPTGRLRGGAMRHAIVADALKRVPTHVCMDDPHHHLIVHVTSSSFHIGSPLSENSAELRRGHNNGVMMMVIHTHVHRSLAYKSFIHPGSRHRLILVCSTRAWMLTAWATASEKVFQGSPEGWTSALMRS